MQGRHLSQEETEVLLNKGPMLPVGAVTVVGLVADVGEICDERDPIGLCISCPNGCCVQTFVIDTDCAQSVSDAIVEALRLRAQRVN